MTQLDLERLREWDEKANDPAPLGDLTDWKRRREQAREELADAAHDLIAEVERLRAAAIDVLSFRDGSLPRRGWLFNNDDSRAALGRLATVVAALTETPS